MLHVLLDTEVFRHENLHFGSKRFRRLAGHVEKAEVAVYVTDVVVGEVRAAISAAVHEAVAHLKRKDTRRKLGVIARSEAANLSGVVARLNKQTIADELNGKFDTLLHDLRAVVLSSNDISVAELRDRYFNAAPPFAGKGVKKHEFPDALSIMAAEIHARDKGLTLHVVSADAGVAAACKAPTLGCFANLQEMIGRILDSILARAAQEIVELFSGSLAEQIKKEFLSSGFYVEDDFEGEVIEVRVLDIDLGEAIAAEVEGNVVRLEIMPSVDFEADLKLTDPDQVGYDSETKSVFVFGFLERRTVDHSYLEGEVEIEVNLQELSESKVLSMSTFCGDFGLSYDFEEEWM